ncbi:hypothetical protein M885DRAFT_520956 [Pelagophyceae sp. CCMP2097]|nr:hypothetical protein M885DRAFT_520956 [Pelagophyceae sp. CCMP2097]
MRVWNARGLSSKKYDDSNAAADSFFASFIKAKVVTEHPLSILALAAVGRVAPLVLPQHITRGQKASALGDSKEEVHEAAFESFYASYGKAAKVTCLASKGDKPIPSGSLKPKGPIEDVTEHMDVLDEEPRAEFQEATLMRRLRSSTRSDDGDTRDDASRDR